MYLQCDTFKKMLGILTTSCIRTLRPFWRNSHAQYSVYREDGGKKHGAQRTEAFILGRELLQQPGVITATVLEV
jgi:hypothetical protein